MPEDDKKFDAALAGYLHREMRDSAGRLLCPEPELLAAHHEGTLSLEEMHATRLHVAGCSRCQEVLAQLAATEEIPLAANATAEVLAAPEPLVAGGTRKATPPRPLEVLRTPDVLMRPRIQHHWRWVAPAGAIAASLVLWLVYHQTRTAQPVSPATVQVAENRKDTDMNMALQLPAEERSRHTPQKPVNSLSREKSKSKFERLNSLDLDTKQETKTPKSNALNEGIVPDFQSYAAPANIPAGLTAKVPSVTTKEKQEMRLPADARAPAAKATETSQIGVAAESAEVSAEPQANARNYRLAKAKLNSVLILSTDPSVVWRVGSGGSIEYSSTAGKKWVRQPSGVTAELTSGSAPQKNICWIVGRVGTILLTTDSGATWQKITSPAADDLSAVQASDALHATIWDAHQKKFETADGGLSWNAVLVP